MNNENILIDKIKEICCIPSDSALAVKLGIKRQAISQVRREEMHLSDERIAELCDMANLDGPTWIAKIHEERAESPKEQAIWKIMLERLTATAATVLVGVGVSLPNASHASMANREALEGVNQAGGPCWNRTSDQRIKSP
ncbi:DUF3693 domain-containing protein, partial [Xylella fastidiosa]|uniref:DUF3693 domain-containing protein n=1 Tax=Xylella fastidiosa TaxID=2371 RepID=UPI000FFE6D7D